MNTNIIETWLHVATDRGARPIKAALDDLADDVEEQAGERPILSHSLLSKWRRGEQSPSPAVSRAMARYVPTLIVGHVLAATGLDPVIGLRISDAALDALADMISLPMRR